jgi:hypothetical protein
LYVSFKRRIYVLEYQNCIERSPGYEVVGRVEKLVEAGKALCEAAHSLVPLPVLQKIRGTVVQRPQVVQAARVSRAAPVRLAALPYSPVKMFLLMVFFVFVYCTL